MWIFVEVAIIVYSAFLPNHLQLAAAIPSHDADNSFGAFAPAESPAPQGREIRGEGQGRLLTAIVRAHISEPDRVVAVLKDLRIESMNQLGQLDPEEWHEMMAAMRSGSVALGSRNKLRLRVATLFTDSTVSSGDHRRAQDVSIDEASNARLGRQSDQSATSTKAPELVSEQESTESDEETSTSLSVSGDSAYHCLSSIICPPIKL
jgi:hypothetical protein